MADIQPRDEEKADSKADANLLADVDHKQSQNEHHNKVDRRNSHLNEKALEDGDIQFVVEHAEHADHADADLEKGGHIGSGTASEFNDSGTMTDNEMGNKIEAVLSGDYQTNELSFRPVDPVDVAVRNLSLSIHSGPSILNGFMPGKSGGSGGETVRILNDISADMPSGQLVALLGASGSGKTSMLNVMSQRMRGKNMTINGAVTFNGRTSLKNVRTAYVMQQDILIPSLTVRETLTYAADLRLSSNTTHKERRQVVEEVILELGLKECADTRIGDHAHKGCSGGEKRRVSIGVQLLANPSVLFLDEPTTGLDSTSAFQLVKTLKNLVKKGRTIITTIHQPRTEIWNLFDRIILLSRGQPLYSGLQTDALPYFAKQGFHLPTHVNPADFLIDESAIDSRTDEAEEASLAQVEGLVASWCEHSKDMFRGDLTIPRSPNQAGADERKGAHGNSAPFYREIIVLTRRTFKMTLRDPYGLFGSLFEAVVMGTLTGWVYYNLQGDVMGIKSRQGALYTSAALQGYLIMLYETWRLSNVDIAVFDREHNEGVVSVLGFLISRRIARVIEDFPVPLIFSTIYYFMIGFRADYETFFKFFFLVLTGQYIAVCFATLAISISRNFAQASLVANLNFTLQSIACGYFIQPNSLPIYVRWTKYLSYVYYIFGALMTNEFKGQFYDCPSKDPGGPDDPACTPYRGDFIIQNAGFPQNWLVVPAIVCVAWAVGYYVFAALLLQFWTVDVHLSKRRPSSEDKSAGKEKMQENVYDQTTAIDVSLDDYKLSVTKSNLLGKKTLKLEILKGITTKFEAGKINVIIGPSGSGKSSLLNLMAQRLHSSVLTRYRQSGAMRYNGAIPSDSVSRALTSYVTQDDDALLASLTVRETLRFAAQLRLPVWMSKAEKYRRAEEVILKLGLKDCADAVIGSEFKKGISGGEKRRVTIAVQLLTEPRLLLLDEPTSGLDAFTASSIVTVLRGLADEGRTVICTIHQSRSDLFNLFDNVLVLARGGSVVYGGPSKGMLSYFSGLGHECPPNTNPADYALDLVTVDLQNARREERSRAKVKSLIDAFAPSAAAVPDNKEKVINMPAELGRMARDMAPLRVSLPVLVHRSMINLMRQPDLVMARIGQVVGLGIILSVWYAPLKNDYYSLQNRFGFIQQILPLYFVGLLQNTALYPFERDVFYREYEDRAYSVEAFLLSYTANEIPFEVISALLYSVLATFAVGLPRNVTMFFVIALNAFCVTSCGESLGIVFNTLVSHAGFAVNVTSTVLSVGMFMAGIMSLNIPKVLQAFNYLSPLKYAVGSMLPYAFKDVHFTCDDSQKVFGQCPFTTGDEALALFGYHYDPKLNIVGLVVCTAAYRMLSYVVLKLKRLNMGVRRNKEKK